MGKGILAKVEELARQSKDINRYQKTILVERDEARQEALSFCRLSLQFGLDNLFRYLLAFAYQREAGTCNNLDH